MKPLLSEVATIEFVEALSISEKGDVVAKIWHYGGLTETMEVGTSVSSNNDTEDDEWIEFVTACDEAGVYIKDSTNFVLLH